MKKNGIGGECSADGGQEMCILGFGCGNPRERNHLEYSNVDGRIILKWNLTNRICGYVLNA
jgi:hypothetical protein